MPPASDSRASARRPAGDLRLEHVWHRYGPVLAVADATLDVRAGEVVGLLGPSGCGKTTLLRVAAGLEPLQEGRVIVAERVVAGEGRSLPPEERGVGLVFQDYALFPHLTVLDNVGFGLTRLPRAERQIRALDTLERVGLADLARAYPHMLSGGQQQRVALARAVAPHPAVLLLDEPFAGLDRRLREQVRGDVLRLLKETGAAVMMVTHDPEEAMAMSDRIALMREGRIEQVGTPTDLYLRPATAFAARFLGETNVFAGVVRGGAVETVLGPVPANGLPEGTAAEVHVRPEHVRVDLGAATGDGPIQATVTSARLLGATTLLRVEVRHPAVGDGMVEALQMGPWSAPLPCPAAVSLDATAAFVFPRA